MYITYEEYKKFGGTNTETAFNSYYFDAQIKIDYYTFDRLKKDTEFTENVKRCISKIIDLLNTFNDYQKAITDIKHPILQSQSNDGVSVTYGGYLGHTSPQDLKEIEDKLDVNIYNVIRQYLSGEVNQDGIPLLYRGVYK